MEIKRKNIYRKIAILPQKCVNCKREFSFESYWLIYHGGPFYTCVCKKCARNEEEAIKKGSLVVKRPPAPGCIKNI